MFEKYAAFVEDNESVLATLKDMLGNKMISARTFTEFKTELLPQKGNIVIWFLDEEIPEIEGSDAQSSIGFNIARIVSSECFVA